MSDHEVEEQWSPTDCLAIKGQDLVCIPHMGPSTEDCICGKVAWNQATGHGDPSGPHHLSPNITRSFFLRLCSEVPILEDTLMRILVIGLSRELPLGPADAMELADHLVKRAAAVQADGNTPGSAPRSARI